jgi:hypothetical protein
LSFLLSFIFLETEQLPYLVLTLMIGALAKETIFALTGYYAICAWKKEYLRFRAVLLLAIALVCFLGVRTFVLHDAPRLREISGVDFSHLSINWNNYSQWSRPFLYTVGVFVPFVVLGWRTTPWRLRSLALYLLPVLFLSSLVFSWLREARNFMPLVAILIVITVHYLLPQERAQGP